jgi:hypothetical protein
MMHNLIKTYFSCSIISDNNLVSCYFIGYSERCRGYKFYNPTEHNFRVRKCNFFENNEFVGGGI